MNREDLYRDMLADNSAEAFEKAMKIELTISTSGMPEGGGQIGHNTEPGTGAVAAGEPNIRVEHGPGLPSVPAGQETILSADDVPVAGQLSNGVHRPMERLLGGEGAGQVAALAAAAKTPLEGGSGGMSKSNDAGRGTLRSSGLFQFVGADQSDDKRIGDAIKKGESLWGEPVLGHPQMPLAQKRECPMCKSMTPAILHSCQNCGDSATGGSRLTFAVEEPVRKSIRPTVSRQLLKLK